MNATERNRFLYETKELVPHLRQKLAVDHADKALALLEQELVMDALYGQMDYKTMHMADKRKYQEAIVKLKEAIAKFG
jgi:hypothetical protein